MYIFIYIYVPGQSSTGLCKSLGAPASRTAARTPRTPSRRPAGARLHTYTARALPYEFIFGDETTNGFNCRSGRRVDDRGEISSRLVGSSLPLGASLSGVLRFRTDDKRRSLLAIIGEEADRGRFARASR